ncbi:DUF4761 family protein [Salmonella enterica]|nr:DUF4761 family protein [Salmonella enterica]EBI9231594.1 DUF4761 domain-containing protein [Salmonella enterica]
MRTMHTPISIGKHTTVYRGFTIHKCPRNPKTMRTPYHITKENDSFGYEFALSDAFKMIDELHGE